MKQLRKIIIAGICTLGVFCSLVYVSCNKNKCGSTTCQNGGTCSENVCICPEGYSGNSCQIGWSDEFVGTYNCVRSSCSPQIAGSSAWQSAITKDATNSGFTVDISNFNNGGGLYIVAEVDSISNITISSATGATGIHGSGKYANGVINLTFTTLSPAGTTFTCNMTMTKL